MEMATPDGRDDKSQVPYTMEELIRKYREIEADAEALVKEQAEAMRPYTEGMKTIKNFILLKLDEQGEKTVKTHAGTAYISSGPKPKVDNRNALLEHVREHDAWDMLDIGVLLNPVKDFLDKSGGEPPPGVTIEYWRRCNIRK
jgi:predicted transcriptional regulator